MSTKCPANLILNFNHYNNSKRREPYSYHHLKSCTLNKPLSKGYSPFLFSFKWLMSSHRGELAQQSDVNREIRGLVCLVASAHALQEKGDGKALSSLRVECVSLRLCNLLCARFMVN